VQQELRLFRGDAQAPPEFGRERRIGLSAEHILTWEFALEAAHLEAVFHVRRERQQLDIAVCEHEDRFEVLGIVCRSGDMEEPDQGDALLLAITECERNTAPSGTGAKICGLDFAGLLVSPTLVGTADIGQQIAITVAGVSALCSRIEPCPRRLDKNGCHRVQ